MGSTPVRCCLFLLFLCSTTGFHHMPSMQVSNKQRSKTDEHASAPERVGRRDALQGVLLRGLGAAALGVFVVEESGAQDLFKAKPEKGINKRTQRLYGCNTQLNCVSVSAFKNPTQFSAAFDYTISTPDVEKAWKLLKDVIAQDSSLTIKEVDEKMLYLRAEGTSKVPKDGVDDVEFLFVPEQKILTYRSASRENVFVYPYQVPIPDGGYQKARMRGIREKLGWVELNYAGDGVYSDGPSSGGGDYVPEEGIPRADKFRLPW